MKRKLSLTSRRCVACATVVCSFAAPCRAGQDERGNARQTTLGEAAREMQLPHEAVPYGVPSSYSWRLQPVAERGAGPPKEFHAITGWGQIFRADGTAPISLRVALRNLRTYVVTTSGKLELIQASSTLDGGQFRPDYKDNLHVRAEIEHDAQGNTVVRTSPFAAFHFWPADGKVSIDPQAVRGVLVAIEARIEPEPGLTGQALDGRLLLSVGADYWLAVDSRWDRYLTNVGIGLGRFGYLDTQWKCFTMTTITGGDEATMSTPIVC